MLGKSHLTLRNGAVAAQVLQRLCSSAPGMSFELTPIQQQLRDTVRKFTADEITPVAAEYDKTMKFPWDVIKKAHACGLVNPDIPEAYGMLSVT
ncbi:hypothetical protein ANCCAN_19786 [Ancylostoma caninum]|uniref:Acyl-CoA dehydrogenase/oxidase N-terminal domain-containing protein n=1 Tax=Ancylostoma caninum TaxID=29170 RepID=A0A368FQM9_ANCCA|nr:hypothetical protein ANCCAN_19786 [Ancylostoma caninum]